jgi:hypothetical protein
VSDRPPQSARTKKLHVWARELGLTDGERIELATYLLRRDITSWTQLDDEQNSRLLDAMEGFQLISALLEMRPYRNGEAVAAEG